MYMCIHKNYYFFGGGLALCSHSPVGLPPPPSRQTLTLVCGSPAHDAPQTPR